MSGRLAGKVAVVTGATSGMGAETARRFVAEGARVVVTGRSAARGAALVRELGPDARFAPMEAGDEATIKAAIDLAAAAFGRLDCLFNNAGAVTHQTRIDKVTRAEFDHEMSALLGSVLFGIKHAIPHLKAAGGGSIINNASTAGHRTGHGPVLYSIAKAGILHLTRVAAIQLASLGIRVNSISPGAIATPIFAIGTDLDQDQSMQAMPVIEQELAKIVPLKRAGATADIAALALFLAGDESRYLTAQDIALDGGLIAGFSMDDMLQKFGPLHAALTAAFPKPA
jgi:NAD(P)-dependent dehydrogenase (short-subunit alcohol dehydrogenase family)